MEMMEARGDLRSIPVVPRGGALFWPAAAQEQLRALSPGPDVSRVASDALHDLRQALDRPPRARRRGIRAHVPAVAPRSRRSPASSSASRSCSTTTTPAPGPRSGSASWSPRTRAPCSWARSSRPCSSACSPPPDINFDALFAALTNNVRCRFCVV
ncbi:hypothetical protein CFC21_080910 [Triticum aestivum]|nr:hypothetical protein CFC21_080910 [Triticum aestivum]